MNDVAVFPVAPESSKHTTPRSPGSLHLLPRIPLICRGALGRFGNTPALTGKSQLRPGALPRTQREGRVGACPSPCLLQPLFSSTWPSVCR